eukprot:bmy_14936T0
MNKSSTAKQCKPHTKPLTYKDLGLIRQLKIVEESKGEVDDTAGILKEKDSNINITIKVTEKTDTSMNISQKIGLEKDPLVSILRHSNCFLGSYQPTSLPLSIYDSFEIAGDLTPVIFSNFPFGDRSLKMCMFNMAEKPTNTSSKTETEVSPHSSLKHTSTLHGNSTPLVDKQHLVYCIITAYEGSVHCTLGLLLSLGEASICYAQILDNSVHTSPRADIKARWERDLQEPISKEYLQAECQLKIDFSNFSVLVLINGLTCSFPERHYSVLCCFNLPALGGVQEGEHLEGSLRKKDNIMSANEKKANMARKLRRSKRSIKNSNHWLRLGNEVVGKPTGLPPRAPPPLARVQPVIGYSTRPSRPARASSPIPADLALTQVPRDPAECAVPVTFDDVLRHGGGSRGSCVEIRPPES